MSNQPSTSAAAPTSKDDLSLEQKIGMAKKFDREMKDYAKATVKEFLGIYGYEQDVDMNMDESESQKRPACESPGQAGKQAESESNPSADCDDQRGKTQQKKVTGPSQARAAVVTIDLENYDVDEVSDISNVEGTSRADCGGLETNQELPSVSCVDNELLPGTLVSEDGTSEVQVESQGMIGSPKESQSELGLQRGVLGSQETLQQSEILESHTVDILQSHRGLQPSESQSEIGTTNEVLQSQRELQQSGCLESQDHETLGSQGELQPTYKIYESQCPIDQPNESESQGDLGAVGETLGSQGTDQSETRVSGESGSHDELQISGETLGSQGTEQSQGDVSGSQDELGIFGETSGSQGTEQSQDGTFDETLHNIGVLSQIIESNNELGIPREKYDERLLSEEATFESNDTKMASETLGETLGETTETRGSTIETLEMPHEETIESARPSTPTPSEILDAISKIIPNYQTSGELAVMQEHSYATTDAEDNPVLVSLPKANPLHDSTNTLDSTSSYESLENQPAEISPNTSGVNSNVELTPMHPPIYMSINNGTVESSDVPELESDSISASVSDVNASTVEMVPASTCTSQNNPPSSLNTKLPAKQSPISDPRYEGRESQHVENFPVQETDSTSPSNSSVHSIIVSIQMAPANNPNSSPPKKPRRSKSILKAESVFPKNETTREKNRLRSQKDRKNETPEKREARLKAQRERAKQRRSQESVVEREARRIKDRTRQQFKRARDAIEIDLLEEERIILDNTEGTSVQAKDPALESSDRDITINTPSTTPISQGIPVDTTILESQDLTEHGKEGIEQNEMLPEDTVLQESSNLRVDRDVILRESSSTITRIEPEENLPERPPFQTVGPSPAKSTKKATPKLSEREKSRLHMRKRRAQETSEKRGVRLKEQRERVRQFRANVSETDRDIRRVRDRIRQQIRRTSESAEARRQRLIQQREASRRRRALASPEEKQARRVRDTDRARKSRESKRAGVVREWWDEKDV